MTFPIKKSHFELSAYEIPRFRSDAVSTIESMGAASHTLRSKRFGADLAMPPVRPELTLVSSIHGKLTRLLVTLSKSVFSSTSYRSAFLNLLQTLPKHTLLDVVVNSDNESNAIALLNEAGRQSTYTLYKLDEDINFSVWAEDAFVVGMDGDDFPYFVEPFHFQRLADSVIADYVSHSDTIGNTSAPLYFQGGNVLIGDDFFLVGMDYPKNTLNERLLHAPDVSGKDPDEAGSILQGFLEGAYQKYLDTQREVIFPSTASEVPDLQIRWTSDPNGVDILEVINRGTGYLQPIFHIDMFISLVGRDKEGVYELLVGDPSLAEVALGISYGDRTLSKYYKQVADYMADRGFKVSRNPLPLAFYDYTSETGGPLAFEELIEVLQSIYGYQTAQKASENTNIESAVLRHWYFATSNNVITESYDDQKTVWIPEYGFGAFPELAITDELNRKIWQDRGFKTIGLGDFHPFAHNLGAAHCITKYLGRD